MCIYDHLLFIFLSKFLSSYLSTLCPVSPRIHFLSLFTFLFSIPFYVYFLLNFLLTSVSYLCLLSVQTISNVCNFSVDYSICVFHRVEVLLLQIHCDHQHFRVQRILFMRCVYTYVCSTSFLFHIA